MEVSLDGMAPYVAKLVEIPAGLYRIEVRESESGEVTIVVDDTRWRECVWSVVPSPTASLDGS